MTVDQIKEAPARSAADPLLRWTDIQKSYGDKQVLAGVSIQVRPGEVFGLLGPNGAGKTTLLAIGAGLERPDAGTVQWSSGRRPALMPQELGIYPSLTTQENLDFVGRACGLRRRLLRDRVDELLEATELERFAEARAATLSGGMKRRLSFACALVAQPAVLMLDEPTVGVDPQSRLALLDLVRQAADTGCAVVYSSHYMEEIQSHADHVAILDEGRVLTRGTVAEVIELHGRPYVELEVHSPDVDGLTTALGRSPGVVGVERIGDSQSPACIRVQVTNRATGLQDALLAALAEGAQVVDVHFREPTLEAAFISLTGRGLRD